MLTEEQRAHRMMSIGAYLPLVTIGCFFMFAALFIPARGSNDRHQDYGLYDWFVFSVFSVHGISIGVGICLFLWGAILLAKLRWRRWQRRDVSTPSPEDAELLAIIRKLTSNRTQPPK